MSTIHRRIRTLRLVLALLLTITVIPALHVSAQDGDITLNEPEIVTLAADTTVRLTFPVLQGDTVEIVLSRLAQFDYTAVLIDADNAALPLAPEPDGNLTTTITNAAVGGTYTLVLQATSGAGQMLVQVNSATPVPLALGTTAVDVTTEPQRFSMAALDTPAVLTLTALDTPDEPGTLPGLALLHAESGDDVVSVQPDMVPSVVIALPAETAFTLAVQSSDTPAQLTVDWQQEPEDSTASDAASSDSSSSSSSDSSSSSSSASTSCVIAFNGPVNVRPGPGTQYEPPLGSAQAGTTLPATGHNGDYSWIQVEYAGQYGWVALYVAATETQGDCTSLPVASDPASPPATTGTPTTTLTTTPSPTYTYTPGGPTLTPAPPTATYTPSYTPTATYTLGGPTPTTVPPTATYTYTYTPTQTTAAPVQPTATYTPSYTPTTPPAAQQAPPDANFNAPLNIPLDNTASVLDFVSYPGGDTIDRVRYDITGMNQNASLSGGRARLVISASCFGNGTENVTFFTGGQTFTCGQTLVDREVTYNSRTGTITIEAIGGTGTYVQWVLTGTATRVN